MNQSKQAAEISSRLAINAIRQGASAAIVAVMMPDGRWFLHHASNLTDSKDAKAALSFMSQEIASQAVQGWPMATFKGIPK